MSLARYRATRQKSTRSAFTLVELLVVITIIGVMAALLTVGLWAAFGTGKNFVIANEITQIDASLEQFKAKLGCYPPDMADFSSAPATVPVPVYFNAFVNKAYPRADRQTIAAFRLWVLNNASSNPNAIIDPAEALVFFLAGTSPDPRYPFGKPAPAMPQRRPAGWDLPAFDEVYLEVPTGSGNWQWVPDPNNNPLVLFEFAPGTLKFDDDNDGHPRFIQKNARGAALVYFDARDYMATTPLVQVFYNDPVGGRVTPYLAGNTFFEPKKYQLISAGQNGEFGVDSSVYVNVNLGTGAGRTMPESDGDNIANFTSGKTFNAATAQ